MVRLKPAGTASPSASTRADTTGLFALLRFISLASKVLSELLSPQPPSLVDCAVTEDELKSVRASEREAAVTSLMRLICVVVVAGSATNEFVASSLLETREHLRPCRPERPVRPRQEYGYGVQRHERPHEWNGGSGERFR